MNNYDDTAIVLFVDSDGLLQHLTAYTSAPNVGSLKHLFQELEEDEEFAIENVDDLRVSILSYRTFKERVDDDDLLNLVEQSVISLHESVDDADSGE